MGLIPIEIKFGTTVRSESIVFLKKIVEDRKCPVGIIINNCERPQYLSEKIIQIPASCL